MEEPGKLDQKTAGVRWVGKLPLGLDYGMEMATQFGSLGHDHLHAWAGHWLIAKRFANIASTPRILAEYDYASGDNDARDGQRGTFDQLYPTAHLKYGLTDQVGWRNIHDVHAGVEFSSAVSGRRMAGSTITGWPVREMDCMRLHRRWLCVR